MQSLDFSSFHEATHADFTPCPTPTREPDFISRSRSVYWDTGDGVVRCSDHWGRVASCVWLLGGARRDAGPTSGWAAYADFRRIVPLSIERDRAVLVAPGSTVPLAGRTVSMVVAIEVRRSLRGARWSPARLRCGRPVPLRRRGRPGAGAAPLRPLRLERQVVTITAETPFTLETACPRRLPRRSHGPAWFVDD